MKYTSEVTLRDGRKCLLRNGCGDDGQAVLDLFIAVHDQTDYLSSYGDEVAFDAEAESRFLTAKELSERDVFLCAVVDEHIVGMAGISSLGGSKVRHRAKFGLSVDKAYWGLGIGRAMMAACIACAKNAGYAQLELEVVGDNEKALSLYTKTGFAEFGRNPRGFLSRTGKWQELISMRLELDK